MGDIGANNSSNLFDTLCGSQQQMCDALRERLQYANQNQNSRGEESCNNMNQMMVKNFGEQITVEKSTIFPILKINSKMYLNFPVEKNGELVRLSRILKNAKENAKVISFAPSDFEILNQQNFNDAYMKPQLECLKKRLKVRSGVRAKLSKLIVCGVGGQISSELPSNINNNNSNSNLYRLIIVLPSKFIGGDVQLTKKDTAPANINNMISSSSILNKRRQMLFDCCNDLNRNHEANDDHYIVNFPVGDAIRSEELSSYILAFRVCDYDCVSDVVTEGYQVALVYDVHEEKAKTIIANNTSTAALSLDQNLEDNVVPLITKGLRIWTDLGNRDWKFLYVEEKQLQGEQSLLYDHQFLALVHALDTFNVANNMLEVGFEVVDITKNNSVINVKSKIFGNLLSFKDFEVLNQKSNHDIFASRAVLFYRSSLDDMVKILRNSNYTDDVILNHFCALFSQQFDNTNNKQVSPVKNENVLSVTKKVMKETRFLISNLLKDGEMNNNLITFLIKTKDDENLKHYFYEAENVTRRERLGRFFEIVQRASERTIRGTYSVIERNEESDLDYDFLINFCHQNLDTIFAFLLPEKFCEPFASFLLRSSLFYQNNIHMMNNNGHPSSPWEQSSNNNYNEGSFLCNPFATQMTLDFSSSSCVSSSASSEGDHFFTLLKLYLQSVDLQNTDIHNNFARVIAQVFRSSYTVRIVGIWRTTCERNIGRNKIQAVINCFYKFVVSVETNNNNTMSPRTSRAFLSNHGATSTYNYNNGMGNSVNNYNNVIVPNNSDTTNNASAKLAHSNLPETIEQRCFMKILDTISSAEGEVTCSLQNATYILELRNSYFPSVACTMIIDVLCKLDIADFDNNSFINKFAMLFGNLVKKAFPPSTADPLVEYYLRGQSTSCTSTSSTTQHTKDKSSGILMNPTTKLHLLRKLLGAVCWKTVLLPMVVDTTISNLDNSSLVKACFDFFQDLEDDTTTSTTTSNNINCSDVNNYDKKEIIEKAKMHLEVAIANTSSNMVDNIKEIKSPEVNKTLSPLSDQKMSKKEDQHRDVTSPPNMMKSLITKSPIASEKIKNSNFVVGKPIICRHEKTDEGLSAGSVGSLSSGSLTSSTSRTPENNYEIKSPENTYDTHNSSTSRSPEAKSAKSDGALIKRREVFAVDARFCQKSNKKGRTSKEARKNKLGESASKQMLSQSFDDFRRLDQNHHVAPRSCKNTFENIASPLRKRRTTNDKNVETVSASFKKTVTFEDKKMYVNKNTRANTNLPIPRQRSASPADHLFFCNRRDDCPIMPARRLSEASCSTNTRRAPSFYFSPTRHHQHNCFQHVVYDKTRANSTNMQRHKSMEAIRWPDHHNRSWGNMMIERSPRPVMMTKSVDCINKTLKFQPMFDPSSSEGMVKEEDGIVMEEQSPEILPSSKNKLPLKKQTVVTIQLECNNESSSTTEDKNLSKNKMNEVVVLPCGKKLQTAQRVMNVVLSGDLIVAPAHNNGMNDDAIPQTPEMVVPYNTNLTPESAHPRAQQQHINHQQHDVIMKDNIKKQESPGLTNSSSDLFTSTRVEQCGKVCTSNAGAKSTAATTSGAFFNHNNNIIDNRGQLMYAQAEAFLNARNNNINNMNNVIQQQLHPKITPGKSSVDPSQIMHN